MSLLLQHKLKGSQKDKVRQFIAFTQTGEKTSIYCLGVHDWKLDVAVDNYFQNPDKYNNEPRASVDRRRLEALWQRYKGKKISCKIHVVFRFAHVYILVSSCS